MGRRGLAILDFDGTLADSADWFFRHLNDVARRYRFREVSPPERDLLRQRSTTEILSHLGLAAWKLPFVAREYRRLASRDIDQIRLFPWAHDLVEELAAEGIALAIVSSNTEANIRRVLGPALADRIDAFATGASLTGKAALMRRARQRVGAAPVVAAIGDDVRDVEAARAAGLDSIAVTWGYASAEALAAARPTRLIHDPAELVPWYRDRL